MKYCEINEIKKQISISVYSNFLFMSLLNIMKQRRSIRKFKTNKVERKKIHKIIEAGIWAPSSGGTLPYKFLVLEDRKKIDAYFSLILESVVKWKTESSKQNKTTELYENYKRYLDGIKTAPTHIFVFFDVKKGAQTFTNGDIDKFKANKYLYNSLRDSLFLCVENMLLQTSELGLGSLYFELPRCANTPVNKFLNLNENLEFFISLPVGLPDEEPKGKERKVRDFLIE